MEADVAVPSHPLGIRPLGNVYASALNLKSSMGWLSILSDEALVQILEYLDATSIISLGNTCKALYAFSRFDELWKTLCVESSQLVPAWQGSWYRTCRRLSRSQESKVVCTGLFSDVLYRPFFCAHTPLSTYCKDIPATNAIPLSQNLEAEDFAENWTDKPFILSAPVKEWPVHSSWSSDSLLEKYGDILFRAEAVDWPLKTYVEYMNDNEDESPLYLFDRSFAEKMMINTTKHEQGDYWPPECFGDDLFAVLADQRPDCRWLIIGPERSGSTFHKDPNATSAWNAVLHGSKYWIMFPSSPGLPPPPGVYVSEDQSEVTSPLSIAEWLINFHAAARQTLGCKEAICSAGEVLHIPSGWWHLVVNLSPSIAITQNFVPEKHLSNVLDFLKNKPSQVSGFEEITENPHELFIDKMEEQHPAALEKAREQMKLCSISKKRKWDAIIDNSSEQNTAKTNGFSFGFGAEEEDAGEEPL